MVIGLFLYFSLILSLFLFALIQFLISRNAAEVSEDLTDFLRVLRNLLLRVRQQKGTSYGANLREEDLPKVIADISVIISYKTNIYTLLCDNRISKLSAFTEESLKYEQEKAAFISTHKDLIFKLEDHNLLQGSLHNFKLTENIDNLAVLCEAMYAIWDKNTGNSLIIRAMLTIGDYSIHIGWCELGNRYFFGTGDRWRTILTQNNLSQAEKVKGILIPFLLDFHKTEGETSNSRLTSMIEVWLNTNPDRDWRYYFIKYSSFTNFGRCLYAWQEASNFEIRHIHNGDTLQSSHINPYIRTVFFGVKERNVIFPKYDSDRWADITPLQLANGIKLNCNNIGWSIELPEGMSLSEELIAEFELRKTDATKLILVGNESLDRVEIAIDFAEKAYK